MKIIQILRKLGILRFGAVAGTYTSGKEIPGGLLISDVYDSGKDKSSKRQAPVKQEPPPSEN